MAQENGRPQGPPGWTTGSHQSTLDTYVLDYLNRRGFRKAASAFATESGVPLESPVPFDAPQGLLFEWWEAFWLIFLASSGKVMNRNATVYVDAIKQRRHTQQLPPGAGQMPPPAQPGPPRVQSHMPPGYAVAGPSGHGGQPMPNGMPAPAPQQQPPYALRGRPPPAGHPAQPGPPPQQQQPAASAPYTPQAQYAAAHAQYQQMQAAQQQSQQQQQQQQQSTARSQQQAEAMARDQAMRAHQFQQQQQYAQQQHQLAAQHAANQQQQAQIGPGGHGMRPGEAGLSRAFIDQCIAACGFAGKSLNQLSQEESQQLREAQAQQRMEMLNQPGGYPPNVEPPYDYVAPSPGAYPPSYGSPQPGPNAPFATTRSARKLQQQQANGGTPRDVAATPTNAPTPPTPNLSHMPAPSPRSRKRARVDAPTPGGTNAPTPGGAYGGDAGQTPQQVVASPAPMHAPSPRNPSGDLSYGIVEAEALAKVPQRHDSMLSQHSSGGGSGQANGYATANGHLAADNAAADAASAPSPAAPRSPLAHDASLSLSQPADLFDFDSLLDFS